MRLLRHPPVGGRLAITAKSVINELSLFEPPFVLFAKISPRKKRCHAISQLADGMTV